METDWGELMNNTPPLITSYCQSTHENAFNKPFKVAVPSGGLSAEAPRGDVNA